MTTIAHEHVPPRVRIQTSTSRMVLLTMLSPIPTCIKESAMKYASVGNNVPGTVVRTHLFRLIIPARH